MGIHMLLAGPGRVPAGGTPGNALGRKGIIPERSNGLGGVGQV